MMKHFSLFLGLRYLRPRRTFVSVITVISVLGVALGVAVLIVVMSVMSGFQRDMKELAMAFETHIEIFDRWGTSMFGDSQRPEGVEEKPWREVAKEVEKFPGVTTVTPLVRGMLLVGMEDAMQPVMMMGLDADDADEFAKKHKDAIAAGELDLTGNTIVIDSRLASSWGVVLGDKIMAYAPTNFKGIVKAMREMEDLPEGEKGKAFDQLSEMDVTTELEVVGIFNPPRLQDMGSVNLVIVPLHIARELYNLDGGISSLGVELKEPYRVGEIKKAMLTSVPPVIPENWEAVTWVEQHKSLFDAVQNELEMMYFVLFFIVIVAAFCVMNTMITVTVQKRREIGIISALGARTGQIIWVFLSQGMIVGVLGSISGFVMGILVVHFRNDIRLGIAKLTGRNIFDADVYGLLQIPAQVVPQEIFGICAGAFALCAVAALVPAFLAARIEPAAALRD